MKKYLYIEEILYNPISFLVIEILVIQLTLIHVLMKYSRFYMIHHYTYINH